MLGSVARDDRDLLVPRFLTVVLVQIHLAWEIGCARGTGRAGRVVQLWVPRRAQTSPQPRLAGAGANPDASVILQASGEVPQNPNAPVTILTVPPSEAQCFQNRTPQ